MRLDTYNNGNNLFANKGQDSNRTTPAAAIMNDISNTTTQPSTTTTPKPVAIKKPSLTNQISFRILDRRKTQRRQQASAQNKMPSNTTPVAALTTNGLGGVPPLQTMTNGHTSLKRSLARQPLPFIIEDDKSDEEVSFKKFVIFFLFHIRLGYACVKNQTSSEYAYALLLKAVFQKDRLESADQAEKKCAYVVSFTHVRPVRALKAVLLEDSLKKYRP